MVDRTADAGSMPYAQWHYPFENEEQVEEGFPADFIVEAIEMTRAPNVLERKNIRSVSAPYFSIVGSISG